MNRMKPRFRSGVFLGVVAILLMFSLSWSIADATSDTNDRTRTVQSATLHKHVGEVLVFVADKGGRIWKLRGKLTDEAQILNENEEDLNSEALELGSVWVLKIEYPIHEGGLPEILEMKRIRPKAAE